MKYFIILFISNYEIFHYFAKICYEIFHNFAISSYDIAMKYSYEI
jgi:hypothetical protein